MLLVNCSVIGHDLTVPQVRLEYACYYWMYILTISLHTNFLDSDPLLPVHYNTLIVQQSLQQLVR